MVCHRRLAMQRAALEARQQDIRDKQLAVQQSTEYIEKLKVGHTAAPAAKCSDAPLCAFVLVGCPDL